MQGQVIDEKARQKEKVFEDRMAASKGLMAEVDEMEKSYNLKGMRESLKAAHANYTQKLKEQEDGGGFWGTGAEGIGRRALAAIAMALGGAGEALGNKSGARVVMNVINQARDRFMQDQERRTARAAQGIDIAGGMLGAMQESMGSELAAKKTMSAFLRQEFNDKLEWMESKFEAPLARAALMSARAGNKRLAAKDMRDAALAYSSIRSKEAAITSNRAKMALAARGKPLTPDFVKKMSEQAMTVQRGLDIAGRVKDLIAKGQGLGVWESSKWAGLMGSKQANIMAEIRAFARQIGRQMGTDKGNFAEREGEIMVKAMTGQNWDKAGASLRNIIILSDQLSKSYMSTAKGLGEDYNTGSLSHQVAAMQKSWSKLKGR